MLFHIVISVMNEEAIFYVPRGHTSVIYRLFHIRSYLRNPVSYCVELYLKAHFLSQLKQTLKLGVSPYMKQI